MSLLRRAAFAALAAAALSSRGGEINDWPAYLAHVDASGRTLDWTAAGPLVFSRPEPPANHVEGVAPLYLRRTQADGQLVQVDVLYPLFVYRDYGPNYGWSFFHLLNRFDRKPGQPVGPQTEETDFDIWPFYFSERVRNPPSSHWGIVPFWGNLVHRMSRDRISWVLYPLYIQTEKDGETTTSTPYPFLRITRGRAHGFALWPLFGWNEWPGAYRREFFLWPLGWNNYWQDPTQKALAENAPVHQQGFIPFYSFVRGRGLSDRTFLWPFFGVTDRRIPVAYHETRYLWPFLVQGRGPAHYVNRWGPFYTHSVIKGFDKTWLFWPLWRRLRWKDEGLAQTQTHVLFFFYWSLEQRSLANPRAAPARKTHLWPLVSYWNNGAGRLQVEALSPFEVFFPDNPDVRALWTPLFAVYRHDRSAPGRTRTSLLWGGVTWSRDRPAGRSEFHLGPLLASERGPAGRRISLLHGLFGWSEGVDGGGLRPFWLEFSGRKTKLPSASH